MHDEGVLLFGVDDVELDEIGALVEGGFEGLHCVLGEEGAEAAVGDVERAVVGFGVGGVGWGAVGGEEEEGEEQEQRQ